jgi:hypothetical protein
MTKQTLRSRAASIVGAPMGGSLSAQACLAGDSAMNLQGLLQETSEVV